MTEPNWNPQKWNASIDIIQEMIFRPTPDMRAIIRDELCCSELNEVRGIVLRYLKELRK